MNLFQQIIEQENKFIHFDSVVEFSANEEGVPGASANFTGLAAPSPHLSREEIESLNKQSIDQKIMASIERRHQKMFLVSQALLNFDKSLTDGVNYWSERARVLLNITRDEADIYKKFTNKDTIKEYIELSDEL